MTADEANALLAGSRKLQLATLNPDGTPHLVTMFYVLQDGQIPRYDFQPRLQRSFRGWTCLSN